MQRHAPGDAAAVSDHEARHAMVPAIQLLDGIRTHNTSSDHADHAFDPRIGRSGFRGDRTGHAICATERHTGDAAAVSESLP